MNRGLVLPLALMVGIMVSVGSIAMFSANGAISNTVSLDNANRREYTWCPINDTLSKTNIEVNGCPVVRVYVNDWNRLTILQQTSIDSQMRALGFVDASEHIIR